LSHFKDFFTYAKDSVPVAGNSATAPTQWSDGLKRSTTACVVIENAKISSNILTENMADTQLCQDWIFNCNLLEFQNF
jgi:hypothetical protein